MSRLFLVLFFLVVPSAHAGIMPFSLCEERTECIEQIRDSEDRLCQELEMLGIQCGQRVRTDEYLQGLSIEELKGQRVQQFAPSSP